MPPLDAPQERLTGRQARRHKDPDVHVLERAVALDVDGLRVLLHHVAHEERVDVKFRETIEGSRCAAVGCTIPP
jgi:hypothetical protein